jgi:hypothetical protein
MCVLLMRLYLQPKCRSSFLLVSRWFGRGSLVVLLGSAALAAQPPLPARPGERVVELPEFRVDEMPVVPAVESWRYYQVGSLEVLSGASEPDTRRLLQRYLEFRETFGRIWPVAVPRRPAALVICGNRSQTDFFGLGRETGADTLNQLSHVAVNSEQSVVILDYSARRIELSGEAARGYTDATAVEYEPNYAQLLFRAHLELLMSGVQPRPPAWLQEGLAQIVMDVEQSDWSLLVGKINTFKGGMSPTEIDSILTDSSDSNVDSTVFVGEQPFNLVLQRRRLIPFDQFFGVRPEDPEARNSLGNTLWAKQAYLFVHWGMFGQKRSHRPAFETFVQRLGREPVSEPLIQECFGLNYAELEKALRAYLRHTDHQYERYALAPEDRVALKEISLRAATAGEIGRLKGDAARLFGQPHQATAAYRVAYLQGGRDPGLLAGLAWADEEARPERSRRFLEAAVAGGVARPEPYVRLAWIRLREAQAAPGAEEGRLSTAQVAGVLRPLFQARALEVPVAELYEVMAEAWAASAQRPTREHLAVLDEGIRRFPRQAKLLRTAAELYHGIGETAHARSIAQLGLRFAQVPNDRAEFERLLTTLPSAL